MENREIKFRIWAKDPYSNLSKEEMIYLPEWTVFDGKDLVFRTDLKTFWIDSSAEGDAKIMQYTGLKDKNDKEIYEGDIVVHANIGKRGTVIFENSCWMVMQSNNQGHDIEHSCTPLEDGRCYFLEIIGNIYENSELIK